MKFLPRVQGLVQIAVRPWELPVGPMGALAGSMAVYGCRSCAVQCRLRYSLDRARELARSIVADQLRRRAVPGTSPMLDHLALQVAVAVVHDLHYRYRGTP